MKIFRSIPALLVSLLALFAVFTAPAAASTIPIQNVSYIVAPHPDDEWQTWALVENSPANYKVFILTTKGEQSGFCDAPRTTTSPMPQGKWTDSCEQARINSFLGFLTRMSQYDSTIPGEWQTLGAKGPFPANGTSLNRVDGSSTYTASTAPEVFLDRQGRGAVISFDLGDGDLTEQEVTWAIKTTIANRAALGINTTLSSYNILGTYYNKHYAGCVKYEHPDHYSVHRSIYHYKFGVVYQSAATCITDPDTRRTRSVTSGSSQAAWGGGGAFPASYGWLGDYHLSGDQSSIFMQKQSFWLRFN